MHFGFRRKETITVAQNYVDVGMEECRKCAAERLLMMGLWNLGTPRKVQGKQKQNNAKMLSNVSSYERGTFDWLS